MSATNPVANPLPTSIAVGQLLTSLLGKIVVARKAQPVAWDADGPIAVAVYGHDDGSPTAAIVTNLGLAARAGAALSLIPVDVAEESIRLAELSEAIRDNLREIFNVCARLFQHEGERHVSLRNVYLRWEAVPGLVAALLAQPVARLDLDLTIPGYGAGKLALLVV